MQTVNFLQKRDIDFDFARSFLVFYLLFAHPVGWYYAGVYNLNVHIWVAIGFVFLAGMTTAVIYSRKINSTPLKVKKKLMGRTSRLIFLFILLNFPILIWIKPERLASLSGYNPLDFLYKIIIMREHMGLLSFEILIPIAFTSFFSWFLMRYIETLRPLLTLVVLLAIFIAIDLADTFNYYAINFLIIGIMGSATGIIIGGLNWNKVFHLMSQTVFMLILAAAIVLYFLVVYNFTNEKTHIHYPFHLIPTLIILFFVYSVSLKFRLQSIGIVRAINTVIATNMLFAYIFHLVLIELLKFFISPFSLGVFATIAIVIFVMLSTICACFIVTWVTDRLPVVNNVYSLMFR